jgi:carbonic anhydrase
MSDQKHVRADVSRRQILQKILSGAIVGVAAQAGMGLPFPQKGHAQSNLSPDGALQTLLAGNQRMVANRPTSIEQDLTILREHTVDKQEPFAGILACADSRVPVELIFDQTIGHLFVTRVAGNMVTPEVIAGLEYGVTVLGIKTLLVLGHSGCGAVKAAMKANAAPGQISALYQHLQPGVAQSGGNIDKAVEANARIQAELLRTSSPVIRDAIKAGELKVEAAVYDLATGIVTLK